MTHDILTSTFFHGIILSEQRKDNKTNKKIYIKKETIIMEAIIGNHNIMNKASNNTGAEKFDPKSLIIPVLGIGTLAFTGIHLLETPSITLVGIIPLVLSMVLMYMWKADSFKYIGWQLGLTAVSILFTYLIFFKVMNGVSNIEAATLPLFILGGYAPAVVNAVIYMKLSKSWKNTVALVLSDPSFIDAVLITLGIFTGYGIK